MVNLPAPFYSTSGFELPDSGAGDKLNCLLNSALKHRLRDDFQAPVVPVQSLWEADYFGLDKVKIFRDSSGEEQEKILQLCTRSLLEEAYFIEKAGVGYMAKMVMLAQTTEERMLYGLFASDEATHLAQISRFIKPDYIGGEERAFLRLLSRVVENEDKSVLLFVIQVVLEGWGLSHYRNLAKGCKNAEVAQMFRGFLQEEAHHHGTGVMLFDRQWLSPSSRDAIAEILALFLRMIQVGPQGVVSAIARVKGHVSPPQKVRILTELDTETQSGTRLKLLRSLMQGKTASPIVRRLDAQGTFEPFSPEECLRSVES